MSTYAIGDLHGEAELLARLLQEVEPHLEAEDTLVFLGDFIDRGPDTRGVVDQVLALRDRAPCPVLGLLGNHEEWLLRTLDDPTRHSWVLGMGGLETVRSYAPAAAALLREELQRAGASLLTSRVELPYEAFFEQVPAAHLEFFRGLTTFVRTPDVVCVHGGARSDLPVEAQSQHDLVWGSTTFPEDYRGPERLVYGHRCDGLVDASGKTGPRVGPSQLTYGIDTVAKGVLTCLRFPDLQVFHCGARRGDASLG